MQQITARNFHTNLEGYVLSSDKNISLAFGLCHERNCDISPFPWNPVFSIFLKTSQCETNKSSCIIINLVDLTTKRTRPAGQ